MADQQLSSVNPFIPPNNPSPMEDAMASLRFDNSVDDAPILYHPQAQMALQPLVQSAPEGPRIQQAPRQHPNANNPGVNLDPSPGDPDTVFIRAPFTTFPGSAERKTGLSYNDMAANPNWFLDVNDFVGNTPVQYPTQLEPPRGWLPTTKKKEQKEGWEDGKEPRLRCTLCRRNYAGVNAKSMWRRHVYEKHKIAMANRRDNNDRPGGRGRGSNKENKAGSSAPAKSAEKEQPTRSSAKSLRRVISLEVQASTSNVKEEDSLPLTQASPQAEEAANAHSSSEEDQSFVEYLSLSSTPPRTPGLSDSLAPPFDIAGPPPESPYNPLMTPAFRHSPAQLGAKQIWRFSPKVSNKVRDYTLAMLARGESSPNVRGLDVSPLVLVPASERQKRSIFSSPRKSSSPLCVSPRRLFDETSEEDSIQSRLDQPGWDVPSTPGNGLGGPLPSPGRVRELEDYIFDFSSANEHPSFVASTPLRSESRDEDVKVDYFALAASQIIPPDPKEGLPPLDDSDCIVPTDKPLTPVSQLVYTPFAKRLMMEKDFGYPSSCFTRVDSSPTPSTTTGYSTGRGSRTRSPTPPPTWVNRLPPTPPLLPAFSDKGRSPPPLRGGNKRHLDDEMEIDESPPVASGSRSSWQDFFNPGSSSRTDNKAVVSTSLSGAFGGISSLSLAGGRRPTVTPSHSSDRSRSRSVSNGGAGSSLSASSGSSSGQKSSIGLMDAVLEKKSRRRKHSHSEYRGEGDVGVTAMGSPFKMGRKSSRSDFLYSLDGDCEMEDAQPRKRRKTISGRD